VWQAGRVPATPDFQPKPYEEFSSSPLVDELLIAIFYTIVGNLDDLLVAKKKLKPAFDEARLIASQEAHGWAPLNEDGTTKLGDAFRAFVQGHPILGGLIEGVIGGLAGASLDTLELVVHGVIDVLAPFASHVKTAMPEIMKALVPVFVQLDSQKSGGEKNQPQYFQDYAYRGLPMDNQADDILVGTGFTEIWVPLSRTQESMCVLRDYFNNAPSDAEALKRTGIYTWELYAAKPNPGWMSMAYSNGHDEWKDGVFRIDVFWYATFAGDPVNDFYQQFWDLLKAKGIPFRLHWGKYQPNKNGAAWAAYFRSQYEHWDEFLALRAQKDPGNVFLTKYWKERFGI
jgi:hypothetical protein